MGVVASVDRRIGGARSHQLDVKPLMPTIERDEAPIHLLKCRVGVASDPSDRSLERFKTVAPPSETSPGGTSTGPRVDNPRPRALGSIMPLESKVNLIVVRAAYDPDAKVWWVEDSAPLGGLNVEARTIDELRDKIPRRSSICWKRNLLAPTSRSKLLVTCIRE